ncbi:LETM1 domain-containing protein 1-like isoform X2 [Uloborus diversus]|uniref:LETM1 domain-containing protein 1-like isoform X2 n=1 Tax=Uloborus diversus TaxID=327109 RepID=UPI00240A158F|nr:LETM1 domain-containing protein 1-like isoform X2 [Uloborus diversus]
MVKMRNISFYRFCSQKVPSTPGSRYVKPLSGIKEYLVQKCFAFVHGYEKILETKFPSAFKIYRVFSVGTKDLYNDIKEYIRISSVLSNGKHVRDLQRKELETYFQVPKDLMKVAPVLVLAALPFANYVILPVIYLFPRKCLSSQFWTLQQKVDFAVKYQKKRLYHYRPVFRQLQAQIDTINTDVLKNNCQDIFYKLGSGLHPTTEEIIKLKPLFIDQPYGIFCITNKHLHHLCRMHGISVLPGKQWRLWKHAGFIREMDLAMKREGLESMSSHELRNACFMRGLSPVGLSKEEMMAWLSDWIQIALSIESDSLSLLLHCPIFLSYNYPSNWVLIH